MVLTFLKKTADFLGSLGAKPEDNPDTRAIKRLLPVNVLAISFLFILIVGPIYIYFNEGFVGWLYIGYAIFALVNLWIYAVTHKDHRILAKYLGGVGLLIVLIGTIALGGIVNSGGVILWGLLVSMMALIGLKMRAAIVIFSVYMGGVIFIALLQPYMRQSNNLPADVVRIILATTFFVVSILVFRGFAYFIDQRNKEEEKVERLLLNILPRDIAAILKNKPHFIADQITMASILFADVVNFTPMSAKMTATELVELLNEVFSYFDLLAEKYGLEKIKTIGDCYMVASGVPQARDDHAQVLATMALELRDYTSSQTFQGKQLAFRIGINSGPVVAGIIGQKKFSYDLWGDTVNTASRMESHSAGNVIQITEDTYELIKDDFVCEPRGVITVKGKGEMNVWYLLGKKE